jgi:hypothetical protein
MVLRSAAALFLAMPSLIAPSAVRAEEFFRLGPGTKAGPGSEVKSDCITKPDGTVECDTKIERSPSDTPARLELDPFGN